MELVYANLVQPPGYEGPFIRLQAEGAVPNGRRIYKQRFNEGDHTPDGTPGTILGSFDAGRVEGGEPVPGIDYFVAWDPNPMVPVLLNHRKINPVDPTVQAKPPEAALDELSAPTAMRC